MAKRTADQIGQIPEPVCHRHLQTNQTAMSPTVSAIIPTYNRAHLLPKTLESVFAQTRPVNEVIVVDDGSTDNTAEVIKSYGSSVRYIRQANAGAGAARNHGMRAARFDYLAFLDSDDLWVPEKNELQMAFLNEHPEVDFVFGDMANFSDESDDAKPEIKDPQLHKYFVENACNLEDLFSCLLIENMIPTPSVMFRRSCVERVGFMDEHLKIAEDLEYWLRVSLCCRCGFLDGVLVKRCRHQGNLINNWAECHQHHAWVLERTMQSNHGISRRAQRLIKKKLADLYYDLGSYYFKQRQFSKCRSYLLMGGPRHRIDWKRLVKLKVSSLFGHPIEVPKP